MQYVHGHACIHNLIDYSKIYWTDPYELLIESKTSCVWAIHPFTELRTNDYDLVCEDFGYTLERVEHPWNSLGVEALWEIAKQFSWRQHIADGNLPNILWSDGVYTRWYENIFKQHYSYDEWLALTHTV
jgi:hypothetical protein